MANLSDARKDVSWEMVDHIAHEGTERLLQKMQEKGSGSFVHRHEIMGCLQEEWHELIEAAHSRDRDRMRTELYDLMVGCMFSIASLYLMEDRR